MPKLVLLISGKRKCGKDYVSGLLTHGLGKRVTVATRSVSQSLKEEYARIHDLNYKELLTDGCYKEKHRKQMIIWGEEIRKKDPAYFCRACEIPPIAEDLLIITDCRRLTDIKYFNRYRTLTVRINADLLTRQRRGFKPVPGIDDAESECALDNYEFDRRIENRDTSGCQMQVDKLIDDIVMTLGQIDDN